MKQSFQFTSSAMLQSCGYDYETKELSVTFTNGKEYIYEDADPTIFTMLITAESAGKYFNSIKKELKVKV
jgi:KTSC domain